MSQSSRLSADQVLHILDEAAVVLTYARHRLGSQVVGELQAAITAAEMLLEDDAVGRKEVGLLNVQIRRALNAIEEVDVHRAYALVAEAAGMLAILAKLMP